MPEWLQVFHLERAYEWFDEPAMVLAIAMAAGMAALAAGSALRIPGILLALATGVALGPSVGVNIVRPDILGEWLGIIIGFCVSVILFEGALSLNPHRLKRAASPVRRLVTVGAGIAAGGSAVAAHYLMGWRWEIAALFGALLIVTGPTVIAPLLRRIKAEKTVSTVLSAEGVLGDAVGAVAATIVFGIAVTHPENVGQAAVDLARIVIAGGVVGLGIGVLISVLGRWRRLSHEGLGRVATLALVLLAFQLSNAIAHESGVVAAVVAGMTVGSMGMQKQEELMEFKEELSMLFIGLLFMLLAANTDVNQVINLAPKAILVAAALVVAVRPLSVLISTIGTPLKLRQRLFIAWIGPRGIVAAAVASLFATRLSAEGAPEGAEFQAVVFLTIIVTVTLAGLTGWPVGKLLGVLAKTNQGWLIFGANRVAIAVALALKESGDEVVMIDRNREAVAEAEAAGISVINGNALDAGTLLRAGVEIRRGVIAMTGNDETNLLFVQTAKRLQKNLQAYLVLGGAKGGVTSSMVEHTGAKVLAGRKMDIALLAAMVEEERMEAITRKRGEAGKDDGKTVVRRAGEVPLLVRKGGRFTPVSDGVEDAEELVLLVPTTQANKSASATESARRKAVPGE